MCNAYLLAQYALEVNVNKVFFSVLHTSNIYVFNAVI